MPILNRIVIIFLLFLLGLPFLNNARSATAAQPETAVAQILPQQTEPINETDTILSPQLSQVFATIGIFIITMFILAIGTEIVVDILKLGIGLQSKPTARQAMGQLKDLLPGGLQDLNISVSEEQQLEERVETLQNLLVPLAALEENIHQLHEGYIGEVIQNFLQQIDVGSFESREELQRAVQRHFGRAVYQINAGLGLNTNVTHPILNRLNLSLNNVTAADPAATIVHTVVFLQGEIAAISTAWARTQIDRLQSGSRQAALNSYTFLRQQLLGLGFSLEQLAELDIWFNDFVTAVDTKSHSEVNLYLDALNNLLVGVEQERHRIQSPLRRFWRLLRRWPIVGPLAGGVDKAWNQLLGRYMPEDHLLLNQPPTVEKATMTTAATILLTQEQRHQEENKNRVKWIRLTSVLTGIMLSYLLEIDSADLLSSLIPSDMNFLTTTILSQRNIGWLNLQRDMSAGILLSGLAASAGSNFWHDQLGRLRSVKTTVEAAASILNQIKQ